jgi:soluble cytochrome b562
MRTLAISILVIAFASACCSAKDESIEELKSHVESARVEDRPGLCLQIAQRQLHNADTLYTDGKIDQARAAVEDVVTYSEKARDSATQSRKHMKNVEIAARKMAEKLHDIKRTLNFEDQPPLDQAIQRLEDVRTTLLKEMFKKEKK